MGIGTYTCLKCGLKTRDFSTVPLDCVACDVKMDFVEDKRGPTWDEIDEELSRDYIQTNGPFAVL